MFCDEWMDCCNFFYKNVVCERKTQCDRAHMEGILLGERELKRERGGERAASGGRGSSRREERGREREAERERKR